MNEKQNYYCTKLKFSIKDFFSKCDQILWIWSHLLKKAIMETSFFVQRIEREVKNNLNFMRVDEEQTHKTVFHAINQKLKSIRTLCTLFKLGLLFT